MFLSLISNSIHNYSANPSFKSISSDFQVFYSLSIKMVAIKNLVFLAASVSAAAFLRRDVSGLQKDLTTINSDTVALTNSVNSYTGSFSQALAVNSAESTLDNDIKSATKDAQGTSGPLSDSDSQSLIDYINNTLEPNIQKAISALEAKKSTFASNGLTSTVQGDLKTLKSDTDSYGSALISLAPSDKTSAAQAALAKIDNDFQGAINYYAS